MTEKNTIALLPLDNRPVSYLLPKQIADFSGFQLTLPERKYLGDLKNGSDLSYIENWLKNLTDAGSLILSLDNWVYGGLVQSRKHSLLLDDLKKRADFIKNLTNITKYGFSSIMRITDYNSDEEEKDYWKEYGEKIFQWSELMYKVGRGVKEGNVSHEELIERWYQSSREIPSHILADYKGLRDKNFTINLMWLESLHKHCFEYLIFSCDDSAKYGMNVVEAEYLRRQIKKHKFKNITKVISGTDEIPLVLITKLMLKTVDLKPTISLYFDSIQGKNELAKYESDSIYNSILNHIETLGVTIKDFNNSNIALCVHCADSPMGDHISHTRPSDTRGNTANFKKLLEETNKPFIILDLAYANGADPALIQALLNSEINWENCYGYSSWNTCSNSTGSALAIGINRWIAESKNRFNKEVFNKCLLLRFLDDYAYQVEIRRTFVTEEEINDKMKKYVQTFSQLLGLGDINVRYSLPWGRSFEVEINV